MSEKEPSEKEPRKSPAAHLAPHRWKKGQCGNPKGRPPKPSLTDALLRVIRKSGEEETMEALARAWLGEAAKGNAIFFRELIERLEGKVSQRTELTGAEGGPIEVKKWSTEEVWARYREVLARGESQDN